MFVSVAPQHCYWVELLLCVGLEMVVWVFEWEWIFDMDVVEFVAVTEVDGKDNMELGMEDIEENTKGIVDLPHKVLSIVFAKIAFGVEMSKVAKERMCSN